MIEDPYDGWDDDDERTDGMIGGWTQIGLDSAGLPSLGGGHEPLEDLHEEWTAAVSPWEEDDYVEVMPWREDEVAEAVEVASWGEDEVAQATEQFEAEAREIEELNKAEALSDLEADHGNCPLTDEELAIMNHTPLVLALIETRLVGQSDRDAFVERYRQLNFPARRGDEAPGDYLRRAIASFVSRLALKAQTVPHR